MNDLSQPSPSIQAYARRLSARLWWLHTLRGLLVAAGAAGLTVLLASRLTEPVLTLRSAIWVWTAALLVGALALAWAVSPAWRLRGARVARVVEDTDAALAHRMRSALELSNAAVAGSSHELLLAHVAEVQAALGQLPIKRLVPWSRVWHFSSLSGLLAISVVGWLIWQDGPLHAFVEALVSPARERSDGTRLTPVIAQLGVRLSYPSYLAREAVWLDDPSEIRVPTGTTLEIHLTPRFAAERGRIVQAQHATVLSPGSDGALVGRYTVQAEARLRFEVVRDAVRYEDPRSLVLHVEPDVAPSIRIVEPESGRLAPPGEVFTLRYVASDDVGIANIQLHSRVEGAAERERAIFSALDDGGPQRELRAGVPVLPDELGAVEGDTLVVWLEARDNDFVSGPHVGRSQEIALEVAPPGRGLSEFIPSLQQIADAAVDLLGQRLDTAPSREARDDRLRNEGLQRTGHAWLAQVASLLRRVDETGGEAHVDVDQIRGMHKRNERLLAAEDRLHAPALHSFSERSAADARHVEELERDVVLLADMLARAHIDEAKSIAEELRALKQHIEDLLSELENKPSPEAERALMQEIAKAQRRLAELAQSLSRMATRVPSEFVNRDALSKEAAENELASLERAVKERDLRSAAQHLDALAKQIDDLANQISQGGLRLQESRFGPRDQAMAEARQKLGMLGAEQDRLTERSSEVMRNALERGQRGMPDPHGDTLAPRAEALGKAVEQIARAPGSMPSGAANRASDRLRDARDALRAGELGQARGMAQSAETSLREAASEMEAEARMFPGHHGEMAQRAAQARKAVSDAERLTDDIDRALPDVSHHMSEAERQRVRADADAQRATADAADQLQRQFEQGPDGLPLSPGATERLQSARKAMQQAERALQRGKPDEANRAQQTASEQLQQLSEALAEQQRAGGRGGRGHKEGGNGPVQSNAHVRIPGSEDWKGPTELRRKLLDAMRENAPSGYEAAIKRYYQELMR